MTGDCCVKSLQCSVHVALQTAYITCTLADFGVSFSVQMSQSICRLGSRESLRYFRCSHWLIRVCKHDSVDFIETHVFLRNIL